MRGRTLPAAVICVVLAGCAASDLGAAAPTPSTTVSTCAAFAGYARMPSTTVTFLVGAQMQTDPPLESVWADFTRCTGIRIVNEVDQGSLKDFYTRLNSGFAPDLTVVAQPGSIVDLVHRENRPGGHPVVPLPPRVASRVDSYWNAAWRAYGTVDGTLYAAPWDANVKSVVWYSPKVFAASGYRVPTTWSELMALSDRVAAKHGQVKPWCGGIQDGAASGWPATDWLEDVVLGSLGGAAYDRWARGDLPFDSPEIRSAMAVLERWMRNPDFVNGGRGGVASIARTTFQDGGRAILDGSCLMYPFATFYVYQWDLFRPGVTVGPTGDIYAFPLPPVNPSLPAPVVGGGDFVVAFSDRPEVQEALTYLTSADWAVRRARLGDVTADRAVPLDAYQNPIARLSAQMLTAPNTTFRFDASDLMPEVVGQGVEWKQLTAWFAEGRSTDDVLRTIDAAWPRSGPAQ